MQQCSELAECSCTGLNLGDPPFNTVDIKLLKAPALTLTVHVVKVKQNAMHHKSVLYM